MSSPFSGLLIILTFILPVTAQHNLPDRLQNILDNTHHSPLYRYPTDLTRDIIPKPLHSHNDCWRNVPFYSALSVGAVSVEADVWLYDEVLYVGHEPSALTEERTLDALYIQPILDTLRHQNLVSRFVSSKTRNGVFDTASDQTLYLFIDLKTSGEETWPFVLRALEPLREAGYLSTADASTFYPGPVTVIGTGNTPRPAVESTIPRDAFFDGPLDELNNTDISALISPIASTDFSEQVGKVSKTTGLNETQMSIVTAQVTGAHNRGILARYWDLPAHPIGTRNAVWRALIEAGVDLLNVDDLIDAASLWSPSG